MLQQTQVKTVIPYWERWMRALPDIHALAEATPETIHKLWEGLGYYSRVRNLQKAAREIISRHQGKFPRSHEAILELPGIGRYTAGAISSIAFNEPRPILDGNVMRVLTRLFGLAGNPREKTTNEALWRLAGELVVQAKTETTQGTRNPQRACSNLNQSLMELGALLCTPKQPKCPLCPVRGQCVAFATNRTEALPNLGLRTPASERRFVAFVINHRGRFLVRQRPAGMVNAHLWEFPNVEIVPGGVDNTKAACGLLGLEREDFRELQTIKHTITRYRITLQVLRAGNERVGAAIRRKDGLKVRFSDCRWLKWGELNGLALTSAHRKILDGILK